MATATTNKPLTGRRKEAVARVRLLPGTGNVQGTVSDKFQATIPEIAKPVWTTIAANPAIIKNPTAPVTLTGGPSGSAVNYKLSELTVSTGTAIWHEPQEYSWRRRSSSSTAAIASSPRRRTRSA